MTLLVTSFAILLNKWNPNLFLQALLCKKLVQVYLSLLLLNYFTNYIGVLSSYLNLHDGLFTSSLVDIFQQKQCLVV